MLVGQHVMVGRTVGPERNAFVAACSLECMYVEGLRVNTYRGRRGSGGLKRDDVRAEQSSLTSLIRVSPYRSKN